MINFGKNKLTVPEVIGSMAIILAVWAVFWYPFELFVFSKDLSETTSRFLSFSREIIRIIPALIFINCNKTKLDVDFKELFSFRFNYKIFAVFLVLLAAYFCIGKLVTYGTINVSFKNLSLYGVLSWLSLALCQETVFRDWCFYSFKSITSTKIAWFLSSVFFSISHWCSYIWSYLASGTFNIGNFVGVTLFTFIFGVLMCSFLLSGKNKSIVPCVILHFLWDLLV